jgi:Skp family chaperone for outer membrane proteins
MKKTALAAILFLGSFGVSQAAPRHPRRAEVNTRLARQNYRIDKKVEADKMSPAEAAKLHKEDHQIRQEEKDMASQDNGHITKLEQKTLNQQENKVSKQIKNH